LKLTCAFLTHILRLVVEVSKDRARFVGEVCLGSVRITV
jgi:hypothetical protein